MSASANPSSIDSTRKARVAEAFGITSTQVVDDVCRRLDDAAAMWPELSIPSDIFIAHVAPRVEAEVPIEVAIVALQLADLYLACACLHGVTKAVRTLAQIHASDLASGLGTPGQGHDDILQELLTSLTVPTNGRPARLAAFSGRGPLGRWLKVVARRHALDALRRDAPPSASEDGANDELLALYGDPEVALVKSSRNRTFVDAIRKGAAALTPKERNVLRYHYVHKLRLDEIAGIYRVSRSTAARRLTRARSALVEHAREAMCQALGLSPSQLNAELETLSSFIDMSVGRLLREPDGR